jgi:hypothetical protein
VSSTTVRYAPALANEAKVELCDLENRQFTHLFGGGVLFHPCQPQNSQLFFEAEESRHVREVNGE